MMEHLKLKVTELVVGYTASIMDVATKKAQILKRGYLTHIYNSAAQKI